jgi:hypothetical protein
VEAHGRTLLEYAPGRTHTKDRRGSPFINDDVSTTNTMACPSCRQIVMANVTSCRHCGLPIDAQTAAAANAAQQKLNSAIIQANALKLSGWVAAIVVVALVLVSTGVFTDGRLLTFWLGPPLALAGTLNWFRRFGRMQPADPDYETARRDVRRAAYTWALALAVELGLLVWIAAR